ncbi:MAG TPA: MogA/MoaB family molybdenum cofactor biosynthesis protein [Anaerolineales bacterium]
MKKKTLRFGILTISDRSSRGERPDLSGPALIVLVKVQGWQVIRTAILPDDQENIRETLSSWADSGGMDVLITTGGTGFAPRDVTPEATRLVIDREAPGLAEAMRIESMKKTSHSMLSRSVTGIRGRVIIINLPGNPNGAVESLQVVLPVLVHAVELLQEDPDAEKDH